MIVILSKGRKNDARPNAVPLGLTIVPTRADQARLACGVAGDGPIGHSRLCIPPPSNGSDAARSSGGYSSRRIARFGPDTRPKARAARWESVIRAFDDVTSITGIGYGWSTCGGTSDEAH